MKSKIPQLPFRKSAPLPPTKGIPAKQFTIAAWTGAGEGEKIVIYGDSGIGKTTLCALLPKPVFIGIDDGGRKLKHPITGNDLDRVPQITNFADVRAALQSNVFESAESIVFDTATDLQKWALPAVFTHVKIGQNKTATCLEDYGYHKGYRHWYDTMLLVLSDCDRWVRKGKNIVFVAQSSTIRIANPAGEDFLKQAPELHHDNSVSILNAYVSWADHVFRVAHSHISVQDGKAGSSNERAVFVHPEVHFFAKSRTISADYPVVTFTNPQDDSIWQLLFGEKENGAR
jgi:energy-coupling factor transporter ATP-binding protein EcfA2